MERTAYECLSDALAKFAKDHDLIFRYEPIDEAHLGDFKFGLYSPDRAWRLTRILNLDDIDELQLDKKQYADYIVQDIRSTLIRKGVIKY